MEGGQETDHRRCVVAACQIRYTTGDGRCIPTNSREIQGQHYSHGCYDHFYTRNDGKYSKLLLVTTCRFSSSCPQIKNFTTINSRPLTASLWFPLTLYIDIDAWQMNRKSLIEIFIRCLLWSFIVADSSATELLRCNTLLVVVRSADSQKFIYMHMFGKLFSVLFEFVFFVTFEYNNVCGPPRIHTCLWFLLISRTQCLAVLYCSRCENGV